MVMTRLLVVLLLPSLQAAQSDTAVLRVGTRAVFVFRSRGASPTLQSRLNAASRRVQAGLELGRDSVSTVPTGGGILVLMGGDPVFVITPADIDTAAGDSLSLVARDAVTQLRLAARDAREEHSWRALLREAVEFIAGTALLVLVLLLLLAARRRLLARLEPWLVAAAQRMMRRGLKVAEPPQVVAVERAIVGAVAWTAGFVVAYVYVAFVLKLIPWTRPWGETLGTALLHSVEHVGLVALGLVPNLAILIVIFVLARLVTRMVRAFFLGVREGRVALPGFHPETAEPSRRIVVALVWLFALVVAYPYVPGSGSVAFQGISVIAGVLVTLGSAGLVGQAMSGLVLMYSRSFRVGDYIQTGGMQGTVVELGLLSTRLRTPKNEVVTVPNNVVVTGAVTDYTASARQGYPLFIHSSVTIGYDTPWRRVHELLITAAESTAGVLHEPLPFVLQSALDDSYVEYQLNAAIDPGDAAKLPWMYGRLHAAIQDAFAAAGVEIMSPSYHAVRDGNSATIPADAPAPDRTRAFRVSVTPPEDRRSAERVPADHDNDSPKLPTASRPRRR